MNEKINYVEYLEDRNISRIKELIIKIILSLNSSIVFHNGTRKWIYKKMGINFPNGYSDVFIARGVILDDNFPELIEIENGAVISLNAIVIAHDALNIKNRIVSKVTIKNKAVIGAGSIILPGVVIGENSIIGAGSVVTKDIPENCIFAGVPARYIKDI